MQHKTIYQLYDNNHTFLIAWFLAESPEIQNTTLLIIVSIIKEYEEKHGVSWCCTSANTSYDKLRLNSLYTWEYNEWKQFQVSQMQLLV